MEREDLLLMLEHITELAAENEGKRLRIERLNQCVERLKRERDEARLHAETLTREVNDLRAARLPSGNPLANPLLGNSTGFGGGSGTLGPVVR